MVMELWILQVSSKVDMKPLGLHLPGKRPEVFMIPWTFQKLNSIFLKVVRIWGKLKIVLDYDQSNKCLSRDTFGRGPVLKVPLNCLKGPFF